MYAKHVLETLVVKEEGSVVNNTINTNILSVTTYVMETSLTELNNIGKKHV
jgi:hypothetical protein